MSSHLRIDTARFASEFGHRPFRIEHDLEDHPLLSLDRLRGLAATLPEADMEWNHGDLDVVHDPNVSRANGLSPVETIERIGDCGSWIVLKRIERDPAYAELLAACVGELTERLAAIGQHPFRLRGFVFVTSPGSVTPLHVDPELNFLLQVRGSKTMTLYDRSDRGLVPARDLERFAAGGHRNLSFDVAKSAGSVEFELEPGQGLHVPLHAPHFVRNGDSVSVSFSMTFQTEVSDRERAVLMVNDRMRRVGLSPRDLGAGADGAKHAVVRSMRSVKGLVKRG